jgi:pimeloyl-ACP methyl ester carboxylesterase
MTVIDHTGHLIPLEQPGMLVRALVPFLTDLAD